MNENLKSKSKDVPKPPMGFLEGKRQRERKRQSDRETGIIDASCSERTWLLPY